MCQKFVATLSDIVEGGERTLNCSGVRFDSRRISARVAKGF